MSSSSEYQVMARTMRPQYFRDVVGQSKVKQTLVNAFELDRLGHAYLFCGPHGTGKTTLARLFAKILNCDTPSGQEPCNQCSSCDEIAKANSLEVIEIDGASNRGIDDIRQINESVSFATQSGKYKIYIIDEVHMLTKEAFNALLKTLEDPPSQVKFFFATTEPHKVPATILSRCQCFQLELLTREEVVEHLMSCAQKEGAQVEKEAADLVAQRASGSLRDALVLMDQVISFCQKEVTFKKAADFLGLLPKEAFFEFDLQAKKGEVQAAFHLAQKAFNTGKNLPFFLETLCEHYRQILYILTFKENPKCLPVSPEVWSQYEQSAQCYSYEQCLHILDLILEGQMKLKTALSKEVALENLLLQIVRSHQRVSIDQLLKRLDQLKSVAPPSLPPQTQNVEPTLPPKKEAPKETLKKDLTSPKSPPPSDSKKELPSSTPPLKEGAKKEKKQYDTLLQFAAVELEGSLKNKGN